MTRFSIFKKAKFIVVGLAAILFIGYLSILFVINFPFQPKGPRMQDLGLLKQRLPEDRLFEMLDQLGSQVVRNEKRTCIQPFELEPKSLEDFVSSNQELINTIHDLLNSKLVSKQFETTGNHSRSELGYGSDRALPIYSNHLELINLLVCHAHRAYLSGNKKMGRESLQHCEMLCRYILTNPTMIDFIVAKRSYLFFLGYLCEGLPVEEVDDEIMKWIPKVNFIKTSMRKAIYWEFVQSEYLYEKELFELSSFWGKTLKFTYYDEEDTLRLNIEMYHHMRKNLDGPIIGSFHYERSFKDKGYFSWANNPVGRILIDIGGPLNFTLNSKYAVFVVFSDATRLALEAKKNNTTLNQENARKIIQEKGLINPFTGKFYQVDAKGNIIVLQDKPLFWKGEKPEELMKFPINLGSFADARKQSNSENQ